MSPKYPCIEVQLSGEDGNAYAIVGRRRQAGRRAGLSRDELVQFMKEAFASDYENVIATAMRWFDCY